jgi:hemerythrin superfamily protein
MSGRHALRSHAGLGRCEDRVAAPLLEQAVPACLRRSRAAVWTASHPGDLSAASCEVARDALQTLSTGNNAGMSNDAIVLLKDDHKQIRKLFRQFEQAGENATKEKGRIVERILEALTVHTYIENEVMYPEVRDRLPALTEDVLESYEEHHVADLICMELVTMSPDDEHFDAKVTVLIENVTHHIEEEEGEWFPEVREGLGRKQLQEIGEQLLEAKQKAPRRPEQPSALRKAVKAVVA